MVDLVVDSYGGEGEVVKVRNEQEYNVVIKIPFAYKETAERILKEFAKHGLMLREGKW